MSISLKRIEQLLGETNIGFTNAAGNPDLHPPLLEFGYDVPRFTSLNALNRQTYDKYLEQQRLKGDQIIATREYDDKLLEEKIRYRDFRELFKKALRGQEYDKYYKKLGLEGNAKRNHNGFMKQVRELYINAPNEPKVMELVSKFAITPEKLQAALDELEVLEQLNQVKERAMGLAQVAREERDILHIKLQTEWADFKTVCNIAFKDSPQTKEIMGIRAYSPGYKPRKLTGEPVEPIEPTEPAEPAEPAEPTEPAEPPALTELTRFSELAQTTEPDPAEETVESAVLMDVEISGTQKAISSATN